MFPIEKTFMQLKELISADEELVRVLKLTMQTQFTGMNDIRGDNLRMLQIIINTIRALCQIGMNEFVFGASFDRSLNVINFVFSNEQLVLQEQLITNLKKFLQFEIKPDV